MVVFIEFDLLLTGDCIRSWEDARFSQGVDGLVYSRKRMRFSDGYSFSFRQSTKNGVNAFFRWKDNGAHLLGWGGFDDVFFQFSVDLVCGELSDVVNASSIRCFELVIRLRWPSHMSMNSSNIVSGLDLRFSYRSATVTLSCQSLLRRSSLFCWTSSC